MLTLYRRHKPTCQHFAKGRSHHHCKCAIWVDGILAGREIRKSVRTRDWTRANREVQKWEAAERPSERETPVTLEEAWEKMLADLEARKLSPSTIGKYTLLKRQMTAYGEPRSLINVTAFDLDTLSQFRATWKDGPRTAAKKLERMRAFFRFAQKRKWVPDNPASDLRAPRVSLCPTMPFTREEMLRILAAIDNYKGEFPTRGVENALRIRALVLLLRYSGMRIGDAVSLTSDRIAGTRLFLYTQKTGVPVNTILPDFVLKALDATPRTTEKHFFWDGTSSLETIVGSWRKRLVKLFNLAKVSGGHAHRFRDTFAVELLLSGVPIERVSVLLGHQSVRITEKHYSPWVRSRQDQLEADVRNAWSKDPLIIEGTKRVQIQ
jgi:integrase/recombinase XerD